MEHHIGWHGVAPKAEEAERARKEILAINQKWRSDHGKSNTTSIR